MSVVSPSERAKSVGRARRSGVRISPWLYVRERRAQPPLDLREALALRWDDVMRNPLTPLMVFIEPLSEVEHSYQSDFGNSNRYSVTAGVVRARTVHVVAVGDARGSAPASAVFQTAAPLAQTPHDGRRRKAEAVVRLPLETTATARRDRGEPRRACSTSALP